MDAEDLPMMIMHVGDDLQKMLEEAEHRAQLALAEAEEAAAEAEGYAMDIEIMLKELGR